MLPPVRALGTRAHKFSVSICVAAQTSLSLLDDADRNQAGWGNAGMGSFALCIHSQTVINHIFPNGAVKMRATLVINGIQSHEWDTNMCLHFPCFINGTY